MRRAGAGWVLGALAVVALGGCGSKGLSRDEVRDRWVATYAQALAIPEEQAACMIDGFFADLNDDQLRPLTKGAELSDANVDRLVQLGMACGVGTVTSVPRSTGSALAAG